MTCSTVRTDSRSQPLPETGFAGQRVHFIGIGGCGMAGLARILLDCGATVTGSDPNFNEQTAALVKLGAKVSRTQKGELLSRGIDLVVRTAAVPDKNDEYVAARALGLPVLKYAQLLGRVMAQRFSVAVAGTHGKTTTSSMVAFALSACGADPSYVIGGTVPQLGGSSHSGKGRTFVVEACEYDRSFHNLHPTVAVINNIEPDHLDCYKDLPEIERSFRQFAELVPPDGLVLANAQCASTVRALDGLRRRTEWIGIVDRPAPAPSDGLPLDWETEVLGLEDGCYRGSVRHRGREVAVLRPGIPGRHNLFNGTMAIAACHAAGLDPGQAADAVGRFSGAARRMTRVGTFRGADLVDDYGHHPTEIRVTLRALRERYRPTRLICVFQPHQCSRTRTLMDEFAACFADADLVVLPDIYSVRDSEEERRLTTSKHLADRVVASGTRALHLPTFPEVEDFLKQNARPGDLILTIGAGNVCDIAHGLAEAEPGATSTPPGGHRPATTVGATPRGHRAPESPQDLDGARPRSAPPPPTDNAPPTPPVTAPPNPNPTPAGTGAPALRLPSPFSGLEAIVSENHPLARHTWYRIGGPARYFVRPRNPDDLQAAVARCVENRIPIYVLGLGANLLVSDQGVDGAVFRLDEEYWRRVRFAGAEVELGAGVDMQKLLVRTIRQGLAGIECLAGIPGTIGGGVRMNAGGKFGDLGASVRSVTVMDSEGTIFQRTRDDLIFSYRHTNIAAPFILGATLALEEDDPERIMRRTKEIWMFKANSQPLNSKNAGCIFKNPGGASAGALIDQAGLKGLRAGGAEVSQKHANFIIAHPGCTADDVRRLIQIVRERVSQKHAIDLETEVLMWP